MWDFAPWTPKDWTSPRERIRLVQSRILCNDDPILDPANPKRSCRYVITIYVIDRERKKERERERGGRESERKRAREKERERERQRERETERDRERQRER